MLYSYYHRKSYLTLLTRYALHEYSPHGLFLIVMKGTVSP